MHGSPWVQADVTPENADDLDSDPGECSDCSHTTEKESSPSSSSYSFLVAQNHQSINTLGVLDHKSIHAVGPTPSPINKTKSYQKEQSSQYSKQYQIGNSHLFLLLLTSSINALMVKVFSVFSGFIYESYDIPFEAWNLVLGISSLSTAFSVLLIPYLLFLRCNMLMFVVQSMQIIGLMLILTFNDYVTLTIGICLIFNTYQIHWGISNTMISCFVRPQSARPSRSNTRHATVTKKRYHTVFNSLVYLNSFRKSNGSARCTFSDLQSLLISM